MTGFRQSSNRNQIQDQGSIDINTYRNETNYET